MRRVEIMLRSVKLIAKMTGVIVVTLALRLSAPFQLLNEFRLRNGLIPLLIPLICPFSS